MGKAHPGVQLWEEYWALLPLLEFMETHTSFIMQDSRAVSGSQPVRSPQPLSHPQSASEVACSVEHQPSGLRGRQHPALLLCGHQRLQLLLLSAIRAAVTLRPAALRDMAGELEAGALLRHHLARRLGLFLQHRAGESPVLRSTLNAWGGSDALQGGDALVPRLLHIHWHNFGGLRGDINSQISLVSFPRQLLLCQGGRWWDDAGAGADIQAAWGCRRRDSERDLAQLLLSLWALQTLQNQLLPNGQLAQGCMSYREALPCLQSHREQ